MGQSLDRLRHEVLKPVAEESGDAHVGGQEENQHPITQLDQPGPGRMVVAPQIQHADLLTLQLERVNHEGIGTLPEVAFLRFEDGRSDMFAILGGNGAVGTDQDGAGDVRGSPKGVQDFAHCRGVVRGNGGLGIGADDVGGSRQFTGVTDLEHPELEGEEDRDEEHHRQAARDEQQQGHLAADGHLEKEMRQLHGDRRVERATANSLELNSSPAVPAAQWLECVNCS